MRYNSYCFEPPPSKIHHIVGDNAFQTTDIFAPPIGSCFPPVHEILPIAELAGTADCCEAKKSISGLPNVRNIPNAKSNGGYHPLLGMSGGVVDVYPPVYFYGR